MCGIVGVGATHPINERNWLTSACNALAHRGPDGSGELWSLDHKVGLGHRRLSIVELTSLGDQPMQSYDGGLSIIFNGEIYNYRELRIELNSLGFNFQSNSEIL